MSVLDSLWWFQCWVSHGFLASFWSVFDFEVFLLVFGIRQVCVCSLQIWGQYLGHVWLHLTGIFRSMLLVLGGCVKAKFLFNNCHLHKCCGSLENTWGFLEGWEQCFFGYFFTKDSALTALLGFEGLWLFFNGFSFLLVLIHESSFLYQNSSSLTPEWKCKPKG